MLPLILASLVNQIQVSPDLIITAHILNEDTVVDMNYLALTPTDFITINHNGLKQIYSLVGKKIFETNDKNINVSELAEGIYIIRIENQNIRFFKQ